MLQDRSTKKFLIDEMREQQDKMLAERENNIELLKGIS